MTSETRTLIVGAGGFAREVFWWMRTDANRHWTDSFAGFLDDNKEALRGYIDYTPGVVDSIAEFRPRPGDRLVMGISNPSIKLRLAEILQGRGAVFATFVHSEAIVVPNAQLGRGSVLCPGAALSCDTKIGAFVTMNAYSGIGHDGEAGDGCTLSAYTEVMGKGKLGRGVFMGSHSSILPGVIAGDFATIGANSLVIRNVKGGTTMVGVPAKRLEFVSAASSSQRRSN